MLPTLKRGVHDYGAELRAARAKAKAEWLEYKALLTRYDFPPQRRLRAAEGGEPAAAEGSAARAGSFRTFRVGPRAGAAEHVPEVTFLGTGSALPSKHRSVSSIWLRVDGAGRGILLDAGEGSFGQMARLGLGVDQLLCVWISHMHADHHLGLVRILAQHAQLRCAAAGSAAGSTADGGADGGASGDGAAPAGGAPLAPLVVVGPAPLGLWLLELARCGVLPVHCWRFYDSEVSVTRREWGWTVKSAERGGGPGARGRCGEEAAAAAAAAAAAERAALALTMQVSVLLCTVIFYANLAHSLTRSP